MPYASVGELPVAVKTKLKGKPKKLRQWMHVWNSDYALHHDESRAFASAWSVVQKFHVGVVTMDDQLNFFLPITKIDKATRTISGYASTACLDSDGEIVSQEAIKAALPDYMQWANIREMHKPSAVGVAQEANHDGRGLFLTAKIVDDSAWGKVESGVYKGFSIGGRKLSKIGNTITKIGMHEISVVDRPSNPECHFTVNKMAGDGGADAYLLSLPELEKRKKAPAKGKDDGLVPETFEGGIVDDLATSKRAKKRAAKLAKQTESASKSSPVAHDVDGGAEAALGKVESRHELDLEGELSLDGHHRLAKLALRGEDTDAPELKLKKGRKMTDTPTTPNESELGKMLIQLLRQGQAGPAPNPTLGLLKAAESDMKDAKDQRKAAEDCVKALFDMHKNALAKSANTFDHGEAVKLVQKLYGNLGAMKKSAKSARENLSKAAGRVSAPGTVEDPLSGVYTPDPGGNLQLISPGEMDNLPASKSISAADLAKYVPADQVDALLRAAKLEAENALLKSMPAAPTGGRRPAGFDPSRFNGIESDNIMLKGINPVLLQSGDASTRETAVAKMVGNLLLQGRGQPVIDPNFHGTAGLGKPN